MNKAVFVAIDSSNSSVWSALSLTRSLLALVVAISHLSYFTKKEDILLVLANFSGFMAVFGFFVISGFSVAASFQRDQVHFYYRRALRILPLYILITTASAILPIFHPGGLTLMQATIPETSFTNLFLNLCFMQGFLTISLETNPVVWTLAIEVFFYGVTPWIAGLSNRALLALIIGSVLAYINSDSLVSANAQSMLLGEGMILTGWTWLIGFWIQRAGNNSTFIGFMIGVFAITLNHDGIEKWWIFTWALPFFAIEFGARIPLNAAITRSFHFAGDVSYPLYLVHFPVYLVLASIHLPSVGTLLLGITLPLAISVHLLYERPMKKCIQAVRYRLASQA